MRIIYVPIAVLAIMACGDILKEPMNDPAYGIVFLCLIGMAIFGEIGGVLTIIDVVKYFTVTMKKGKV